MLRIAHFVSGFPVPSETFVLDEIAAFAEEGFENIVVSLRPETVGGENLADCLKRSGQSTESLRLIEVLYPMAALTPALTGLSVRSLPVLASPLGAGLAHPREFPKLVYTVKRILETVRPLQRLGVAHCHAHFAHYPAAAAWGCSRLLRTPFTWNAHSYDLHLYSAQLERRIQDASLLFPVSEANRRFIEERAARSGMAQGGGPAEARIRVCRCGIRLEDYTVGANQGSAAPLLLGVGRLVDSKGFADLVRAVGLLKRSGSPAMVRIIGEGPEREFLSALARSLDCADRLELVGRLPRDQVREEQRRATLLVMPCCQGKDGLDGIPVVLMEAMALGTPVVATRFAGIPELVEDGVTGRLVPPNQPQALARAISGLLGDPPRRERLAVAARRVIEESYDGPRNYREKARLVKELIVSRQRPAS